MAEKKQIVVIGGGPAGYVAAFRAADLGLGVTLIDPEEYPGGVCLYRGCIPSKALLHVAKVIEEARHAADMGVTFGEPTVDVAKLRAFKEGVVRKMVSGLGELAKRRNVIHVRGLARFTGPTSLKVDLDDGGEREMEFAHAILATGSRPAMLRNLPSSDRIWTSTQALDLPEVPKKLLVVGGGYIGLELGSVYAALGSKVSVVEMLPGLLPGADRDLVAPLARRAESLFERILLETTVVEMKDAKKAISVTFKGKDGKTEETAYDRVLVSIGRRPNSNDLGIETTKAKVTEKGFVEVDAERRTAERSIFAVGDVAGEPMLAHKGSHEGIVAAEVIAGRRAAWDPHAIPAVIFTDPEIAWCGLTETEAKASGRAYKVARYPWSASGRATTLARNDGVTKLLIDPETEIVLGVGIAGAGAGELISEGVLAVEMAARADDLAMSIHPHPTLSETIMEAAEVYHGQSPHLWAPKRK